MDPRTLHLVGRVTARAGLEQSLLKQALLAWVWGQSGLPGRECAAEMERGTRQRQGPVPQPPYRGNG